MSQEKLANATEFANVVAGSLKKVVGWAGSSQELWVQNLDDANDGQISFDGGEEWWTIPANRVDVFYIDTTEIHLRRAGGSDVAMQVLIFLKN